MEANSTAQREQMSQNYMEVISGVSHVTPLAYTILVFSFMGLAIITATARTAMRISRFKRIDYDDVLLIVATLFMIAAAITVFETRDLAYTQLAFTLGIIDQPASGFASSMDRIEILDNVASITTWGAIFSVKFAFIAFFKKLVARIKNLERWWWFVVVFLAIAMPINMFAGFMVCTDFGPTLFQTCTDKGMTYREMVYQYLCAVLDILSDVLVISVPIALLWRVKIDLRRKLALGTVCCLSVVMIVLAIVRVADSHVVSPVSSEIPSASDSPWLFCLQIVEASVAIMMVSVTAFRSMLGQKSRSGYMNYNEANSASNSSAAKNIRPRNQSFELSDCNYPPRANFSRAYRPKTMGPFEADPDAERVKSIHHMYSEMGTNSPRPQRDTWGWEEKDYGFNKI